METVIPPPLLIHNLFRSSPMQRKKKKTPPFSPHVVPHLPLPPPRRGLALQDPLQQS